MKEALINSIKGAFVALLKADGCLFECPVEEESEHDSRKLHEVCINHKLSNHLERAVLSLLENNEETFFVDIEFNKEGTNPKKLLAYDGQEKTVRPDIIIHNRKSGKDKANFLVVECKKEDATKDDKKKDKDKLIAFMTDDKYKYKYALQVFYGKDSVKGILFYFNDKGLFIEEEIEEALDTL